MGLQQSIASLEEIPLLRPLVARMGVVCHGLLIRGLPSGAKRVRHAPLK
jgi:hypothetical protein